MHHTLTEKRQFYVTRFRLDWQPTGPGSPPPAPGAARPTRAGARFRYQVERTSAEYQAAYKQHTANKRINSQALELGIERPKLRRQSAITNQNTLIYVLINLRALQRVQAHQEELARQPKLPIASGA